MRIDKLVNAGILKDKTSERDIVPHFETTFWDGTQLVLWVDHPDSNWRAVPTGPRYGIELYRKGELPRTEFSSNNLKETLDELQLILSTQGFTKL
jgi:hypothetical protein